MGCWNATCCLSNLPITYGEEVYVWVITRNESNFGDIAGNFYANGMYCPISFAIEGKYNDYGCIEEIVPGVSADYIETLFDSGFLTYSTDADKGGTAQEPIEQSIQAIERGKVLYCGNKPLDLFIARKDVTDKLCFMADEVMADYPPAYEGIEDSMPQLCKTDEDLKKEFGVSNVDDDFVGMVLYTNKFLRAITDVSYFCVVNSHVRKMFMSFIRNKNLSEKDKFHLLLTIKMNIVLYQLRKCWIPQPSGVGSQAWGIREMKHFCEVVLSICDRELKGH